MEKADDRENGKKETDLANDSGSSNAGKPIPGETDQPSGKKSQTASEDQPTNTAPVIARIIKDGEMTACSHKVIALAP